MKCIIAIVLAMLMHTVCMAQTVTGLISYPHAGISGTTQCPQTLDGNAVYPVNITLYHGATSQSSVSSTVDGYSFTGVTTITPGSISLFPSSLWGGGNAWLNGVTVADQSMIQQHILNNTLILCPFRLIAADMNTSGNISTSDVLAIQILLVNSTPPGLNNQPWRFIAKNLVLPDFNPDPIFLDKFWSLNPFAATTVRNGKFLKYIKSNLVYDSWMNYWDSSVSAGVTPAKCTQDYSFFAIKMGDVSGDAQTSNLGNFFPFTSDDISLTERSASELRTVSSLLADERYEVKITATAPNESICAYQVGLKFDDKGLGFEKPKKTKERALKQSDDNFTTNKELLDKGEFRSAWTIDYAIDKTGFEPNREVELFSFNVKAKKDIAKITDAVSLDKTTIDALFFNYDVKPIKDVKLFISIRQLKPDEE